MKELEKEKISIVVPIYNVEKYLNKCIESIVNQTYSNLEILLIDDGSTDGSKEICDLWEKKDERIKVIHKENGGLSDARNKGIQLCRGKYISFIDSDDFISEYYIEYLFELLIKNGADIACCGLRTVLENMVFAKTKYRKKGLDKRSIIFNKKEGLEEMLYSKYYNTSANLKLYKIELFKEILFPKGKIFEDMFTIYKVLVKANKIVYGFEKLYYYLIRETSITGSVDPSKRLVVIDAEHEILNYVKYNMPEVIPAVEFKILESSINSLVKYNLTIKSKKERLEIENLWKDIKKYRVSTILNKKSRKKYKFLAITSFLGKNILKKVYNLISIR